MTAQTTESTDWTARIQAARAARVAAAEAEDQLLRDAVDAGYPIARIAEALGQRNRQRIYDVLSRAPGDALANPPAVPLVYLRGAGRKQATWDAVERAMWMRGWRTTHDRTDAWHCARGGVPVVFADFTRGLADDYQSGIIQVGRVRARYGDPGTEAMELPFVTRSRADVPDTGAEIAATVARMVSTALDGGTLDSV